MASRTQMSGASSISPGQRLDHPAVKAREGVERPVGEAGRVA